MTEGIEPKYALERGYVLQNRKKKWARGFRVHMPSLAVQRTKTYQYLLAQVNSQAHTLVIPCWTENEDACRGRPLISSYSSSIIVLPLFFQRKAREGYTIIALYSKLTSKFARCKRQSRAKSSDGWHSPSPSAFRLVGLTYPESPYFYEKGTICREYPGYGDQLTAKRALRFLKPILKRIRRGRRVWTSFNVRFH